MKPLVVGITLLGTFLLVEGCSSQVKLSSGVKSGQTNLNVENKRPNPQPNPQPSPTTSSKQSSGKTLHTSTKKRIRPRVVKSTSSVPLAVEIQGTETPVSNLSSSQSQNPQMHLFVVSDDLRFFQHEIPTYKAGRFEINHNFPAPGNYTVFSNYTSGQKKQVTTQKLTISGNVPLPTQLESFTNTKTLSDTQVTFNVPESKITANKLVQLRFKLHDAKNNQPVKDLQPHLNVNLKDETARLVIVRSSSPLTASDYIPANVLPSPEGQLLFTSTFPQKGTYKLWLQFNRNGKINTADFWLNVI
ncbi:MAG: hypothetical protein IGS39_17220 [Calothrix sp. C42_A2020_038]|nr:hypothetical protein [Calothrix sp. C42_A2020_038]